MKLAIFLSLLKKEDFIKLLKKGVLKPYLLCPNVANVLSFVTDHGTTGPADQPTILQENIRDGCCEVTHLEAIELMQISGVWVSFH